MNFKVTFCSLLAASSLMLHAEDHFEAVQLCTMQSQDEAANRYGQTDFSHFVAGSGIESYGDYNGRSLTMKGYAYFDLEDDDLREELKEAEKDDRVLLSFELLQVVGKPRELRIEYIGTVNDKDSDKSRAKQFQANQIASINRALEQNAEPGLKVFDVTGLVNFPMKGRWLVIRFSMDGERIEDGQNDLYQFNSNNNTVRLTITDSKQARKEVTGHYQEDGAGSSSNIIADMPSGSILPDMGKLEVNSSNVPSDMSSDLVPDMSSNILPDMNTKNILPDMNTKNIIDDQNNQQ